jgi:hypothetical protein
VYWRLFCACSNSVFDGRHPVVYVESPRSAVRRVVAHAADNERETDKVRERERKREGQRETVLSDV